MKIIPSFIISSCLLLIVHSQYAILCVGRISECQTEIWEVESLLNSFLNISVPATIPMLTLIEEYCEKAISCVSCAPVTDELNLACQNLGSRVHGLEEECIAPVLQELYDEEDGCGKDHEFFTINSTTKNGVYMAGKDCLLEETKKLCSTEHHNYFTENYETFINLYTKLDSKYTKPYYKFQKMQCHTIGTGFPLKLKKLNSLENPAVAVSALIKKSADCFNSLLQQ